MSNGSSYFNDSDWSGMNSNRHRARMFESLGSFSTTTAVGELNIVLGLKRSTWRGFNRFCIQLPFIIHCWNLLDLSNGSNTNAFPNVQLSRQYYSQITIICTIIYIDTVDDTKENFEAHCYGTKSLAKSIIYLQSWWAHLSHQTRFYIFHTRQHIWSNGKTGRAFNPVNKLLPSQYTNNVYSIISRFNIYNIICSISSQLSTMNDEIFHSTMD